MKTLNIISAAVLVLAASTQAIASNDSPKTRAQVKTALAEAIRTGDIVRDGETGLKLNVLRPDLYPSAAGGQGKSREQVRAELQEAIRTGEILAGGEQGLKRNELRPDIYPQVARGPGKTRERRRSGFEAQRVAT
jgi:hypothetical protein